MKTDQKNITVTANLPYVTPKYSYKRQAPQISSDVTLVSNNTKAQTLTVKFDLLSEDYQGNIHLHRLVNQTASQIINEDNGQAMADLMVPVLVNAKGYSAYRLTIRALLASLGFKRHDVFNMSFNVQGYGYMGGTGVGEKIHHLVYDLIHDVKDGMPEQVTQLANMYLQGLLDDRNDIHRNNKHLTEAIKPKDLVVTLGCRPICQYSVAGYTAIGYPVAGGSKEHVSCSKCKKAKYIPDAPNPAPGLLAADGQAMKQISKRIDAGKKVTGVTVVTSRNSYRVEDCDSQEKHDDITTFRGGYSLEITLKFERGGKVDLDSFSTRTSSNPESSWGSDVYSPEQDAKAMTLAQTIADFYGVKVVRTDAELVHVTGVEVKTQRNYFYSTNRDTKVDIHTFADGIDLRVKLVLDNGNTIELGSFNTSKRVGEYKRYSFEPALEQDQVAMDLAESVAKSYGVKVTREAKVEQVSGPALDHSDPKNQYKSQQLWVESTDPKANNNPNQ